MFHLVYKNYKIHVSCFATFEEDLVNRQLVENHIGLAVDSIAFKKEAFLWLFDVVLGLLVDVHFTFLTPLHPLHV